MKTTGLLVFTHSIAQHYKDSEGYTDMCAMVLNSNAGVVIIWDNMDFGQGCSMQRVPENPKQRRQEGCRACGCSRGMQSAERK